MRYLPTLEIGNQTYQLALPDIHAISLAECCLTQDNHDSRFCLRELMLSSPMLLFWLWVRLHQESLLHRETLPKNAFTENVDVFVTRMVDLLRSHASELVKDNAKPLSSIMRVESDAFLDMACYFEIKTENADDFCEKIVERLVILNHCAHDLLEGWAVESPKESFSASAGNSMLVSNFRNSDFSQLPDRLTLFNLWQQKMPFFKRGFGDFEKSFRRLNVLETEFEARVEREKISAIQQLAYGASHEINNPLANISTRAQALLRDESDPKRRQRLETIDAQAFRAHDMISNLMTFAKPRRPQFRRFQLRPVAEKSVAGLSSLALERGIEINLDIAASVYLEADKEQVEEIIFALVQNAIEAIRESGRICIECELPSENQPIKLEIVDSGPGISPEVRRHIFDPFFSGREAGRGLGFGMSKVWSLMQLHGGNVQVTEKNGLTSIELSFPVKQELEKNLEVEKTA